jgi:Ni/Co efflux regulator RcnB
MRSTVSILIAAACIAAPFTASAQPAEFANRDNPKWFEPIASPQQLHANLVKEAKAALKENLAECATLKGEERKACEREARTFYQQDLERARSALSNRQPG